MPEPAPSHVLPLENGWSLWRWFQLRSAGFPAAQVLDLASPAATEAADRFLALERRTAEARHDALSALSAARDEAVTVFDREAVRLGEVVRAIARDGRIREAIAWQNRAALRTALDPLLARPATARDDKSRRMELLVANYLQRYCLKNDTIGYFGPSVFGMFAPDGEALSSRPGPGLLRRRVVHLEYWAVDALATRLARLPGIKPWLLPRRLPLSRLEGGTLVTVFGTEELSPQAHAVLARCDGERTARALAAEIVADPSLGIASEAEVFAVLDGLERRGAVSLALEIPPSLPPFTSVLRGLLFRIEDPIVRQAALEPLARIEAGRDALARAAGDPNAVDRALGELEALFVEITGEPPTRSAGEFYVGRTLAYEECRRDVDVVCGPELRNELAAPLSLLLASCRWFTHTVSRRYHEALKAIYDDLKETDSDRVPFLQFWLRAGGLFKSEPTGDNPGTRPVVAELQARWARLLQLPDDARRVHRASEQLAASVAEVFAAPCPGWPTARYQSPDLMIVAEGPEAIRRGDYLFVLGEIHAGYNQLENSIAFGEHPAPDEFLRALDVDLPGGRVAAVPPKGHGIRAALLNLSHNPRNVAWEYASTRSARSRPETIAISDVVVTEVDGWLRMCTRDGRRSWDFAAFLDMVMGEKRLGFLPAQPHTPRVTLDRLVLCREAWRFDAADVPFARLKSPAERFISARRWAHERGLPRWVFVRATSEPKPLYADLESPLYVDLLAKLVRKSTSVTLTELLPGMDQCWLADAEGRWYTSELRIVAVDPEPWRLA